jgi:hypothetical protein
MSLSSVADPAVMWLRLEAACGSKKHTYRLRKIDPVSEINERIKSVEPLPENAMFKYRTVARRYQVMSEIEK